jgi:hypothetical protein
MAFTTHCKMQEELYTCRQYTQRDWGGILPDKNALTSLEA